MSALFFDFVKIMVPLVAAIITFFLGRISMRKQYIQSQTQRRFDEFYFPFLNIYRTELLYAPKFKDTDYVKFIALLHNKYFLVDHQSQTLILKYLDALMVEDFALIDDILPELFTNIFREYSVLCKKLKYPEPALPPLPPYVQAKRWKQ